MKQLLLLSLLICGGMNAWGMDTPRNPKSNSQPTKIKKPMYDIAGRDASGDIWTVAYKGQG